MSDWWYPGQLAERDRYGYEPFPEQSQPIGALAELAPPDERGLQPQAATIGPAEMRSYDPSWTEKLKGKMSDLFRSAGADPYNAGKMGDIATTGLSILPPVGIPLAVNDMQRGVEDRNPTGIALGALGAVPGAKGVLGEIAKPFYSAAGRAVENAKLGKGTAEQWLGYLRNQPGVKPEELEWVFGNLPKDAPLTKAQMQAHAAENAVQLGEVRKGGSALAPQEQQELNTLRQRMNVNELTAPEYRRIEDLEHREAYGMNNTTKYQQWQLPGGENYRETLLTLPEKAPHIPTGRYVVSDGSNFNMAANTLEEAKQIEANMLPHSNRPLTIKEEMRPDKSASFQSSHWDEPNVLAHVRTNDRAVPGVGKSLHLEEIQSDWHQKGRSSGYRADDAVVNPLKEKADAALAASRNDPNNASLLQARDDAQRALYQAIGGVPDAPFKSTWADVALKRQIREAAEKGYDAISWTPGEAQAARYDLSKQVDSILHNKNPDGTYKVSAQINGRGQLLGNGNLSEAELSDHVGKEIAQKIIADEGKKINLGGSSTSQPPNYWKELSGLDLKIGGEGMRGFYDKMLVDKANAIGKKHGARVERSELPKDTPATMDGIAKELGYGGWHSGLTAEQRAHVGQIFDSKKMPGDPVHVLRITPELREAAMKGFPLFALGGVAATGAMSELARQDNYGKNE